MVYKWLSVVLPVLQTAVKKAEPLVQTQCTRVKTQCTRVMTTNTRLQKRLLQGYWFSSASQTVCTAAHPNNQQQVVPKVDPKVVAQMYKVILQQVCICNATIPCVHLQRNAPKLCSWPYLHASALGHIYMLDQCQDLLVCVCAAGAGLISAASLIICCEHAN